LENTIKQEQTTMSEKENNQTEKNNDSAPHPTMTELFKDIFPDKQYCPNCDAKQPWGYRVFGRDDQGYIKGRYCMVCGRGLPMPGIRVTINQKGSAADKDQHSDA